MTIRGGGNPKLHMVLRTAGVEWAPPPRSFATDAHAASWSDPTAIYRIQVCRATFAPGSASSPRKSVVGIWPPLETARARADPAKPAARARDRQGQVASRWGPAAHP